MNSRLKELVTSVTSAAVAGKQKEVDLHCNNVLAQASHITEMAALITTVNKTHQQ